MKQINIRLSEDEYRKLSEIAAKEGMKITTLLRKKLIGEYFRAKVTNEAFEAYKKGKLSLNKVWRLTGLSPSAFLEELKKRAIEPSIKEEVEEYTLRLAKTKKMGKLPR